MILSPPTMAGVEAGTVAVLGTAFAGKRGITRVEVTTDDGGSWTDADLTYQGDPGSHIWTTWRYNWVLDGPGEYTVRCRVTDEDGGMSDPDPNGSAGHDGYNGGMEITVRIT
jgi:hypothetical protein